MNIDYPAIQRKAMDDMDALVKGTIAEIRNPFAPLTDNLRHDFYNAVIENLKKQLSYQLWTTRAKS